MNDKFHGLGGSYSVNAKGERVEERAATRHHAEGDRAREADGTPVDKPATTTEQALPKPAAVPPWAPPVKASGKAAGKTEKA